MGVCASVDYVAYTLNAVTGCWPENNNSSETGVRESFVRCWIDLNTVEKSRSFAPTLTVGTSPNRSDRRIGPGSEISQSTFRQRSRRLLRLSLSFLVRSGPGEVLKSERRAVARSRHSRRFFAMGRKYRKANFCTVSMPEPPRIRLPAQGCRSLSHRLSYRNPNQHVH